MKNLLIATTALVATAGMASAEITFSGKGEAGMYRTAKTKAVAKVAGGQVVAGAEIVAEDVNGTTEVSGAAVTATATDFQVFYNASGVLTTLAASDGAADAVAANVATTARATADSLDEYARHVDEAAAKLVLANAELAALVAGEGQDDEDEYINAVAEAKANLALANAVLAAAKGTAAVAAVKSGDMAAYSGYDMNVAVSAETDNGIVFGMGFDMGAGLIADQNDDRAMDTQGETIATSALTATMSGYTLSIGSDKLDDVYDDTQNGDIGLSGNVGGVAFNLVHDLTDEVVAVAASTTASVATAEAHTFTKTAAIAATVETTSLSLGGAAGAVSYSFAMTTGNDSGDSAAKGSLTYTGVENLSLTLAHDNAGKLEGISKVTAKYTMGSLTATLSMADDKNHVGNTNKNKKASNNLSLAYAANGLAATFATDESSQWWVNTQYDLGGGAQAFATIDHTEFAVVGLNFNF